METKNDAAAADVILAGPFVRCERHQAAEPGISRKRSFPFLIQEGGVAGDEFALLLYPTDFDGNRRNKFRKPLYALVKAVP